jgi:hypothetical protein
MIQWAQSAPPAALQGLMTDLRRTIQAECPALTVRVSYAPFHHMDALVEIRGAGAREAGLGAYLDATLQVAAAQGYTVALLMREPGGAGG